MKNLAARIRMARMTHRLEASFAEIHTYQLNHKNIPKTLIQKTLTNISNLLEANRQLQAVDYLEAKVYSLEEYASMVRYTDTAILTEEQLLNMAQIQQLLTNLEEAQTQKDLRKARQGHG